MLAASAAIATIGADDAPRFSNSLEAALETSWRQFVCSGRTAMALSFSCQAAVSVLAILPNSCFSFASSGRKPKRTVERSATVLLRSRLKQGDDLSVRQRTACLTAFPKAVRSQGSCWRRGFPAQIFQQTVACSSIKMSLQKNGIGAGNPAPPREPRSSIEAIHRFVIGTFENAQTNYVRNNTARIAFDCIVIFSMATGANAPLG
jgi:hypothetical protein